MRSSAVVRLPRPGPPGHRGFTRVQVVVTAPGPHRGQPQPVGSIVPAPSRRPGSAKDRIPWGGQDLSP
jgi:hypothetical protein